jgi:serine protease Do
VIQNKKKLFIFFLYNIIFQQKLISNDLLEEAKVEFTANISEKNSLNNKKWVDIIYDATPCIVQIFAFKNIFNFLEPYKTPEQECSCGTGFFIDDLGTIITNAHVVNEAQGIFIQMPEFGRDRFEVELLAIYPGGDLALLRLKDESYEKIIKNKTKINYLSFGSSDNVNRAEEIMTLGFPLGQEWLKATNGIVSGIQNLGNRSFIQISAAINPGNSGGPALNHLGEVIGINTCVINTNGTQNVGYIIPSVDIDVFLNCLNKKINNDDFDEFPLLIQAPFIGIIYHGSPGALVKYLNNPLPGGLYIVEVLENSLAGLIGLKKGDMIYSINDYQIDQFADVSVPWSRDKISLAALTSRFNIGDKIKLEIYRNGEKIEYNGFWDILKPIAIRMMYPAYEQIKHINVAGLVIMELTINHLQLLGKNSEHLSKYMHVVKQIKPRLIISHVMCNSIAQHSRIMFPGMIIKEINGIRVNTLEDFEKACEESIKTGFITFLMDENEFFVAELKRTLIEEKKLSEIYFYEISDIIKKLSIKLQK